MRVNEAFIVCCLIKTYRVSINTVEIDPYPDLLRNNGVAKSKNGGNSTRSAYHRNICECVYAKMCCLSDCVRFEKEFKYR